MVLLKQFIINTTRFHYHAICTNQCDAMGGGCATLGIMMRHFSTPGDSDMAFFSFLFKNNVSLSLDNLQYWYIYL